MNSNIETARRNTIKKLRESEKKRKEEEKQKASRAASVRNTPPHAIKEFEEQLAEVKQLRKSEWRAGRGKLIAEMPSKIEEAAQKLLKDLAAEEDSEYREQLRAKEQQQYAERVQKRAQQLLDETRQERRRAINSEFEQRKIQDAALAMEYLKFADESDIAEKPRRSTEEERVKQAQHILGTCTKLYKSIPLHVLRKLSPNDKSLIKGEDYPKNMGEFAFVRRHAPNNRKWLNLTKEEQREQFVEYMLLTKQYKPTEIQQAWLRNNSNKSFVN